MRRLLAALLLSLAALAGPLQIGAAVARASTTYTLIRNQVEPANPAGVTYAYTIPAGVSQLDELLDLSSVPPGANLDIAIQQSIDGQWVTQGYAACQGAISPKTGQPSGCGLEETQQVAPGQSWRVVAAWDQPVTVSLLQVTLS